MKSVLARRQWLLGGAALVLAAGGGGYYWYRSRQRTIDQLIDELVGAVAFEGGDPDAYVRNLHSAGQELFEPEGTVSVDGFMMSPVRAADLSADISAMRTSLSSLSITLVSRVPDGSLTRTLPKGLKLAAGKLRVVAVTTSGVTEDLLFGYSIVARGEPLRVAKLALKARED